jgi:hypothetical protein
VDKEEDELTKKRTDPRVAFLLKMPGQQNENYPRRRLQHRASARFRLELHAGKIDSPQAAASWFTANRSRYPVRVVKPMFH